MLTDAMAVLFHDPELQGYPADAPFSPSEKYPEYRFGNQLSADNRIYAAVREFLRLTGMDGANYGYEMWNPLGEIIRPGNTVVIKPNLVLDVNAGGGPLDCVITHGSVIRAVVDYVLIALCDSGHILIGDAPLQSADFEKICEVNGLKAIVDFYAKRTSVRVQLADFRREHALIDQESRLIENVSKADGDPSGYAVVDFGRHSMHAQAGAGNSVRYRVTNYDPACMSRHHGADKHEYLISRSILSADVVISLPKMKTHRKAGVTGALKNLVGINGHKDWLPHHTAGSKVNGGDEYQHPSMLKAAARLLTEAFDASGSAVARRALRAGYGLFHYAGKRVARDAHFEGSWWGNDTLWRTVLDLNRALRYANRDGILQGDPQRRLFVLMDGVVAGEGEGPIEPSPKPIGVLLGGTCSPVIDSFMARLMGFDYRKIPSIREAFAISDLPLLQESVENLRVVSNDPELAELRLTSAGRDFCFVPTEGWRGHVELDRAAETAACASASTIS